MGRKGVSKRKPNQVKDKSAAKGSNSVDVASAGRSTISQLVKSSDSGHSTAPAERGSSKNSPDAKKSSKKR